jgi:hypothetical protein
MNGINFVYTSEVPSVAYYNVRLENFWTKVYTVFLIFPCTFKYKVNFFFYCFTEDFCSIDSILLVTLEIFSHSLVP